MRLKKDRDLLYSESVACSGPPRRGGTQSLMVVRWVGPLPKQGAEHWPKPLEWPKPIGW